MKRINLKKLLNIFKNKKLEIKIEDRVKLGYSTYGIINQAELLTYINPTDNELWDIIIPGYDYKIRRKNFKTNDTIGICYVEDGNHKIFMKIDHKGFNKKRAINDIKTYLKNYKQNNNLSVKWESI